MLLSVHSETKLLTKKTKTMKKKKLSLSFCFSLTWNASCLQLFSQVDIYESRTFIGGKVGSFVDRRGNHIEMGLHVFFGCYNNLFRLLKKVHRAYHS